MKLKIKVKYRGKWYYVTGVDIDRNGELYFGSHYLHDGDEHGVIDIEHIKEEKLVYFSDKTQKQKESEGECNEVERRCLIHGLKHLLKDAGNRKITPVKYSDNYWEIQINKKQEDVK